MSRSRRKQRSHRATVENRERVLAEQLALESREHDTLDVTTEVDSEAPAPRPVRFYMNTNNSNYSSRGRRRATEPRQVIVGQNADGGPAFAIVHEYIDYPSFRAMALEEDVLRAHLNNGRVRYAHQEGASRRGIVPVGTPGWRTCRMPTPAGNMDVDGNRGPVGLFLPDMTCYGIGAGATAIVGRGGAAKSVIARAVAEAMAVRTVSWSEPDPWSNHGVPILLDMMEEEVNSLMATEYDAFGICRPLVVDSFKSLLREDTSNTAEKGIAGRFGDMMSHLSTSLGQLGVSLLVTINLNVPDDDFVERFADSLPDSMTAVIVSREKDLIKDERGVPTGAVVSVKQRTGYRGKRDLYAFWYPSHLVADDVVLPPEVTAQRDLRDAPRVPPYVDTIEEV